MLDLSLLTAVHGLFAAFAAIAAAGLLALSQRRPLPYLTGPAPRPGVRYAGRLLILVLAPLAAVQLPRPLAASLGACAVLIALVGRRDETRPLSPATQLGWQITAAAIAALGGWSIQFLTDPRGGAFDLVWWQTGPFLFPGTLLTVGWLVVLMNSVNWLDGLDGLAPSVAASSLSLLAAVSLLPQIQRAPMLSLALTGAAGCLVFAAWNWPPARVFLGTSGSWFLGLYLGLTGLSGGGKLVTTALILAWPLLDAATVIAARAAARRPLWQGDRTHLHFRLQQSGVSPARIVVAAIVSTLLFGLLALMLQTAGKITALLLAALLFAVTSWLFWRRTVPLSPS